MKGFFSKFFKNKKAIIITSIILAIAIIGVVLCFTLPKDSDEQNAKLTREIWVEMFGEKFGYSESKTQEPYFTDIDKKNGIFFVVQALKEDGVIDYEKVFEPKKNITFDEMLVNVSRIYGETYISNRLNKDSVTIEEQKEYIRSCTKLSEDYSDSSILTKEEASLWLAEIHTAWVNREFGNSFDSVQKESVQNKLSETDYVITENTLTFSSSEPINVGDVILLGANNENSQGIARKVETIVSQQGNTYTLTVSEPAIEEIFESFELEFSQSMEEGKFVAADGVTVVEDDETNGLLLNIHPSVFGVDSNKILPLSNSTNQKDEVLFDRKVKISSETWPLADGKPLTVNPDFPGGMGFSNTDKTADGVFIDENGNKKNKFDAGFELECGLRLSNFKLSGSLDWNGLIYLSEFNVNASMDVTPYFALRGNASQSFRIGSMPFQIGYGFNARVDLYIVISINGEVSVEPVIHCNGTVRKAAKAYIPRASGSANCNTQLSISADLGVQVGPDVTLSFLDVVDFVDAYVFVGVGAETSWDKSNPTVLKVQAYLPTLHIGIGKNDDTLLSELLDVFRDPQIDWAVIDQKGGTWPCPLVFNHDFEIVKAKPMTWDFKNGVLTVRGVKIPDYMGENVGETLPPWFRGTQQNSGTAEEPNPVNVEIKKIIIEEGVTYIGAGAFGSLSGLTEVIFADTVIEIGENAFAGCEALENVTLPDSIVSIGGGAFYDCINLKTVTFGNKLTKIGAEAFMYCPLQAIKLPDSLEYIGVNAFANCEELKIVEFGNGALKMGREAFAWCTSLEKVNMPLNMTRVPMKAFYGCSSLKEVVLSPNTKEIGMLAFGNCRSLTKCDGRDTAAKEEGAFYNCVGLGEFDYGDSEIWEDKYSERVGLGLDETK